MFLSVAKATLVVLIFFAIIHSQPTREGFEDPKQDFAFFETEYYPEFKSQSPADRSQAQYGRIADQISFPLGHIDGNFVFGSFKNTLFNRDVHYNGTTLNDGLMQRYWLSGGVSLISSPRHASYFIAGAGLNSDFADLGSRDLNTEWIYTHVFHLNRDFQWGLGLDVQQYSGRFLRDHEVFLFHKWQLVPFPLFFMDWRFCETAKLVWDADFVEVRKFFGPRFAVTAGSRFNMEFFALKDDASYEYQSAGAEMGVQYSVGKHCYLRLKYKELYWGRENFGLPNDDGLYSEKIASGRSLRLNLTYGI